MAQPGLLQMRPESTGLRFLAIITGDPARHVLDGAVDLAGDRCTEQRQVCCDNQDGDAAPQCGTSQRQQRKERLDTGAADRLRGKDESAQGASMCD